MTQMKDVMNDLANTAAKRRAQPGGEVLNRRGGRLPRRARRTQLLGAALEVFVAHG